MADGFRIATAFVKVSPDMEGFKEELKERLDEAVAGVRADAKVGLDTAELDEKADRARSRVDELSDASATPTVRLDDAGLAEKTDDAKAKLDELDSKSARPDVGLEAAGLDSKVDEARAKLEELDAKRADPRLDLDTAEFDAKLDAARARLAAFNEESASPRLGGSGGGGGGGGGEGGGEGSLGGAVAMGIGALLPGIAPAAASLGLMGGVGALAFGGVGKALSAAHQASQNVGLTPQQQASTDFSNSVQIQQAQQQVAMAHEQAAQDAVSSARAIESSQMNLASVERNAAASQVQAIQSVEQSQQGLEEANYNLSEAQYNLTQAWVTAREEIVQLNDQLSDSKLSVQAAQLAIAQAIRNQRLVDQNAYSTSIDRQQAALGVLQAQQQLQDASDAESAAQTKANLANKQGVAGSQTVVQAKQAVTAAQYGQIDAQMQAADAQRNLTLTELNNADQIKQAQMQVAAAEEQAAYQQMVDAQQIAVAQRNVSNTYKEQQLQIAATKSTINEAANQFSLYMSRLTPAGRAVVNQILGMKSAFKLLSDAAQNAVLPGFSIFLSGVQKLVPTLGTAVGKMGTQIGDAFAGLGKKIDTPAFTKSLQGLIDNGIRFAQIVMPALGGFIGALASIGSKKGAADGLANLLGGILKGLSGLATSVGQNTAPINAFLTAVGNIITQIGPPLGTIIGLVARALGPLTGYLNAHPNGTVAKVLGDIAGGLLAFKGLQKLVGGPFKAIKNGFNQLTGLPQKARDIAKGISDGFSSGLGATKNVWGKLFGKAEITDAEGNVIPAIEGLLPKIGRTIQGWGGSIAGAFRKVMPTSFDMKLLLQGVKGGGSKVAQAVSGWASSVAQAASGLWSGIGSKAGAAAGGISQAFGKVSGFFTGTLPGAVSKGAQSLSGFASSGITVISGWGSKVGQAMSSAGTAVVGFVAQMGRQLAAAAVATGTWIAEQSAAAATFIAENVAEAVAATVAFVAENAATLGIVAGIAILVTAIIFLATHWKQVWGDIQAVAMFLWHNVLDPMWRGIAAGATWLYNVGIAPLVRSIQTAFGWVETAAMWMWHNVFDPLWQGISAGASDFIRGFQITWNALQGIFKTPVNFLISTVYDKGIATLWNDTVTVLGMKSLQLPIITPLAKGGVIPGYAPGHDSVPAVLSPGEGVLVPEAVRAIGPDTVNRLNAQYGGGRKSSGNHFGGGGILGGIVHGITSTVGKIVDAGKITAALATGNTTALSNALTAFVGTNAVGDYAKLMLGLPTKLIGDAVQALATMFTGSSGAGGTSIPTAVTGSVAQWFAQAVGLTGVGAGWIPDLETIGHYESGDNPNAINNTDSNAAAGDPSRGIMQTIMSTFQAYHQAGTSSNIFDPVANIAAAINYIKSRYGTVGNVPGIKSLASGGSYVGYDSGGWLMPGGMPVNGLRKPEAVLTPAESAAFVEIVRQLKGLGANNSGIGGRQATVNFYGTQMPGVEQMAAIKRDLALALGGAG